MILTKKSCLPSVGICQQIQLRKLKTPGGILVFRVLVQVCGSPATLGPSVENIREDRENGEEKKLIRERGGNENGKWREVKWGKC